MPPLRRRTLHALTGKPPNRPVSEAGNDRSSVSEPQLSITSEWRVGEEITRGEQNGSSPREISNAAPLRLCVALPIGSEIVRWFDRQLAEAIART